MSTTVLHRCIQVGDVGWCTLALLFRPLQAALATPSVLYIATLTVMLFRPPPLEFFCLDRLALILLALFVLLRAALLRQSFRPQSRLIWPMAALLVVVCADLLFIPFDVTIWSVAIAKYIAPFAMFYLAGLVFNSEAAVHRLETFSLIVLGYLSFIAIAFLAGWNELIFPKFILDDSLGINAERARGPFLQAVANGTSINLLGLVAIDAYRRGRLRGITAVAILGALPIAILATKTRAVWLSFASSLLLLTLTTQSSRVRRLCIGMITCGVLAVVALVAGVREIGDGVQDRFMDRGTAEFRLAAYEAGWRMFLQQPLTGWGAHGARQEIEHQILGFQPNMTVVHNTYLEILLEHGILGFALYAWIMVGLFNLGRTSDPGGNCQQASATFPQVPCRPLWPLMLGVFFVNATFVVMNYQFVNGLLFTWAGILAHRQRSEAEAQSCR